MRAIENVTELLHQELDEINGIDVGAMDSDDRAAILTPLVEVARVLGVTEEEWVARFRQNAAHYESIGMEFR